MNNKELKKLNEHELNNINGGGIGLGFVELASGIAIIGHRVRNANKNKKWTGRDSAVTIVGGLLALWGLKNFMR